MMLGRSEEMSTGELDPRYKIRAPLRCHGVGRLDCAEDTESGVRMAIRWLPLSANGAAAVKAVEQLPEHPILPRIRQTGSVGSSAYVAMEFPEGRLLSTVVEDWLGPDALLSLGSQLADALAMLHAQGVVHGELSAGSVLLLPEPPGRAVLWDVPLALASRLTDRRGEERALTLLTQTAPCLAPERARGLPASASSDVYSLAALLCLAGGARPPVGTTVLSVLHQVATCDFVPVIPAGLAPEVQGLLGRMLSADPLQRPVAGEVAELFSKPVSEWPVQPTSAMSEEQEQLHEEGSEPALVGWRGAWERLPPKVRWGGLGLTAALLLSLGLRGLTGEPTPTQTRNTPRSLPASPQPLKAEQGSAAQAHSLGSAELNPTAPVGSASEQAGGNRVNDAVAAPRAVSPEPTAASAAQGTELGVTTAGARAVSPSPIATGAAQGTVPGATTAGARAVSPEPIPPGTAQGAARAVTTAGARAVQTAEPTAPSAATRRATAVAAPVNDSLEPLVSGKPRTVARAATRSLAAKPAVNTSKPTVGEQDFSFLPSSVEAPKNELKQPRW
jgi:eukaryotic-like serine/threonine-protein kinase